MISEEDTDQHLSEVLEILKEIFEGGGKWALLYAIYHCCLVKRPLPEWLQFPFFWTPMNLQKDLKSNRGMTHLIAYTQRVLM